MQVKKVAIAKNISAENLPFFAKEKFIRYCLIF